MNILTMIIVKDTHKILYHNFFVRYIYVDRAPKCKHCVPVTFITLEPLPEVAASALSEVYL